MRGAFSFREPARKQKDNGAWNTWKKQPMVDVDGQTMSRQVECDRVLDTTDCGGAEDRPLAENLPPCGARPEPTVVDFVLFLVDLSQARS